MRNTAKSANKIKHPGVSSSFDGCVIGDLSRYIRCDALAVNGSIRVYCIRRELPVPCRFEEEFSPQRTRREGEGSEKDEL